MGVADEDEQLYASLYCSLSRTGKELLVRIQCSTLMDIASITWELGIMRKGENTHEHLPENITATFVAMQWSIFVTPSSYLVIFLISGELLTYLTSLWFSTIFQTPPCPQCLQKRIYIKCPSVHFHVFWANCLSRRKIWRKPFWFSTSKTSAARRIRDLWCKLILKNLRTIIERLALEHIGLITQNVGSSRWRQQLKRNEVRQIGYLCLIGEKTQFSSRP